MLLVKHCVRHDHFILPETSTLETVAVYIHLPQRQRILIVSLYNPPGNTLCREGLETVFSNESPVVLLGDFNSKHPAWNCTTTNRNGRVLLDYCIERSVTINPPELPTFVPPREQGSVLDIALSRGCHMSTPHSIPALSSDHNPVVCKLRAHHRTKENRTVLDYGQANWPLYLSRLNHFLAQCPHIRNDTDLDRAVHYFTASVLQAAAVAIPRKEIKRQHICFPPSIGPIVKFRNYIRRRFQRSRLHVFAILHSILNRLVAAFLQRYQNEK